MLNDGANSVPAAVAGVNATSVVAGLLGRALAVGLTPDDDGRRCIQV